MRKITASSPVRRAAKAKPLAMRSLPPEQRYDANIDHILRAAATVFAEKSFGLASIRDVATQARISFPRIYYYLRNKDELLYLISRRTFEQVIALAEDRISTSEDPEERVRLFIRSHLEYHTGNPAEMKVLAREADSLGGRNAADILRLKREYSRICRRLLESYAASRGRTLDREQARIVTSLLFGAMNWLYTWYEPGRDFDQRGRIMDECFRMIAGSFSMR